MRSWGHPDLNWFQVEPVRGKFDFRTADRIIDAYRACNVNILAVLGYPPLWAAEPPPTEGERAKFRYRRGEPGRWKPRSVDEWRNYVRNVAGHFTGRVRHYEIYNEVDFHPPGFAESFSGTTEEYFELLKSASQEIRAADTANQVLVSGFSNTPTVCDMEMPEKLVSLGAGDWVDIWNVHSYRAKVGMAEMKALADRARPGMPIWQTEQMWHVINDPARRSYLTAAINLWFLELGFDKYFSFGWGRDTLSDEHTNSPEPSLQAFAVSQYFLDRCDARRGVVKGLPEGEFDVNCELVRRDGKHPVGCRQQRRKLYGRIPGENPRSARYDGPQNRLLRQPLPHRRRNLLSGQPGNRSRSSRRRSTRPGNSCRTPDSKTWSAMR